MTMCVAADLLDVPDSGMCYVALLVLVCALADVLVE